MSRCRSDGAFYLCLGCFISVAAIPTVALLGYRGVSQVVDAESGSPVRVQCEAPASGFTLSPEDRESIVSKIVLRKGAPFTQVLHAVRTFDPQWKANEPAVSAAELLRVASDYSLNREWYPDRPSFLLTRQGIRVVTENLPCAQSHRGQALSVLAELGVPLDTVVAEVGKVCTVRDLLRDDVAHFDLDGETEWSSLAYALYLPPRKSWENRFGEQFDFETVTRHLMVRPFEASSCGGTHALYTLVNLLRVSDRHDILSASTKEELERYLTRVSLTAVESQLPDGSIEPQWYRRVLRQPWYVELTAGSVTGLASNIAKRRGWNDVFPQPVADEVEKVLVTGHTLEWLAVLPSRLQVPPRVYELGGGYLLESVSTAPEESIRESYCPYSHAVRMMLLLDLSRSSQGSGPQPRGRRSGLPRRRASMRRKKDGRGLVVKYQRVVAFDAGSD